MSISTSVRAPLATASRSRVNESLRYAVIAGCAASVGVHIGIIPAHVDEGASAEVAAFAASSLILAALALLVLDVGHDSWAPAAAAACLSAVAAAYLLSRTIGLPWLVTEPEPFDLTGLSISVAELASAAAGIALSLHHRKDPL
jgi:hypothetical protein